MRRNRNVLHEAEPYIKKNNRRSVWQKCVRVMGSIVVFCTTYALILPAITMVKDTQCQLEEHIHDENCYIKAAVEEAKQPTCTYDSLGVHVHTQGCYDDAGALLCGSADYLVHVHGASCTDEEGALLCRLPEVKEHEHTLEECYQEVMKEGHIHTDSCYIVELGGLVCEISENEGHTHSDGCYVRSESLTCGQEEAAGHTHGAECYQTTVTCTLPADAHVHGESCYELQTQTAENGDLISDLILVCTQSTDAHVHGEGCSATALVCTTPEAAGHAHSDGCYDRVLSCTAAEGQGHTHGESCYAQNKTLACGLEENQTGEVDLVLSCDKKVVKLHSHGDACYETWLDENNQEQKRLSCTELIVEEHVHGDGCFTTFEVFEEEPEELTCGLTDKAGHTHSDACMDESGSIICGQAEEEGHQHTFLCYGEWELICEQEAHTHSIECNPVLYGCGLDEHKHDENCYAADGTLTCGLEEHSHNEECALPELTEEEQARVDAVIAMIDAMPSADEIDGKIAEFEEAEDYEGEEAYLTEVYAQVGDVYFEYRLLRETLQLYVTNADKLLELEYIWSITTLSRNGYIQNDTPRVDTDAVSTKDFVELNLYDYFGAASAAANSKTNINSLWASNKAYPGFQWNGGAYMTQNSDTGEGRSFNRRRVDNVDFGNSMITDFSYGGTGSILATEGDDAGEYVSVTNGLSVNRQIVVNQNGLINQGIGYTNSPIGISTGTPVISRTLVNGYPALVQSDAGLTADQKSLSYLFTESNYAKKMNTSSIDGLFKINPISGLYSYNCRENHAQYNYNNTFTLYEQVITPNMILYPFGNFLPFNQITNNNTSTQVSKITRAGTYIQNEINALVYDTLPGTSETKDQLIDMLARYRTNLQTALTDGTVPWNSWNAAQLINDFFTGYASTEDPLPDNPFTGLNDPKLQKLYNIDYSIQKNFFFGMDMSMNIMMPKNGLAGSDNGDNSLGNAGWEVLSDGTFRRKGEPDGIPDYPMVFNFSGDDDVWVYIDGVLFLDLSGIHRHVGGTIDFETGEVYYFKLDTQTGDTHQHDANAKADVTLTFEQILTAAGKNPADYLAVSEEGYYTFKDYSTHEFKFFYMERGSGSSVCRINFNFPILRRNTISVEKELTADSSIEALGNPDFTFQILAANDDGTKPATDESFFGEKDSVGNQWAYNLYDVDGSVLQRIEILESWPDGTVKSMQVLNAEGKVVRKETTSEDGTVNIIDTGKVYTIDENGCFTLKAGQRAEFVGIQENWGKYYVRELINTSDFAQYGEVTVNGSAVTRVYDKVVENVTFNGFESAVMDTSDGSTSFVFENKITTSKLTDLSITKELITFQTPSPTQMFRIYVELDGKPVPAGTVATITNATDPARTSTTVQHDSEGKSYIEIAPGEIAKIHNIISGTRYKIWEAESKNGDTAYKVSYSRTPESDEDEVQITASDISGLVRVDTEVVVKVTNSDDGVEVKFPVTKSIPNFVNGEYSYNFAVKEADATGKPLSGNVLLEQNVTSTSADWQGEIGPIPYLRGNFTFTEGTDVRYYLIYETGETGVFRDNTQAYMATVTFTDGEQIAYTTTIKSGTLNADGAFVEVGATDGIAFSNILKTSLVVTKTVDHGKSDTNPQFSFRLNLARGESGVDPAGMSFGWIKQTVGQDGKSYEEKGTATYDATNGFTFTLGHGDSITFTDLPVGMAWTVTETNAPGYLPSWSQTAGGEPQIGEGTTTESTYLVLETVGSGNKTEFTNTSGYELPETGGAGTLLYTMAGLVLIFSAAYLLYRYQNRRRGAYESP